MSKPCDYNRELNCFHVGKIGERNFCHIRGSCFDVDNKINKNEKVVNNKESES